MSKKNNKFNTLVCSDTEFAVTEFYINGALAERNNGPYHANPHRQGSMRHDEWNYGHENESAGEHIRFGSDILAAKPTGQRFEEDPAAPRDKDHTVSDDWYRTELATLTKQGKAAVAK
jgi:hypothetical protein